MESKLKVLVLLPAARIGGAEKNVIMIMESLEKEGFDVVLAIGSEDGGNKAILEKRKYLFNNTRARDSILSTIKTIAIENPNVVFLNLGYLYLAIIIRIIYPKIKIIARIGNTVSSELPESKILKFIAKFLLKISCFSCAKIVVQSNSMKIDLLSLIGQDGKKITVLLNPVEEDFISKVMKEKTIETKSYIFCAASFKKQKRIDILIKSTLIFMMSHPGIDLVVAGVSRSEMNESGLLEGMGEKYINRMHFLGYVSNIYPLIRDSIFCVSSSDYEGSSNYLIEAKMVNKFCLVTDCPGSNREIFSNQENVLFVEPNSIDAFAAGMERSFEKTGYLKRSNLNQIWEISEVVKKNRLDWRDKLMKIFND